MPAKLNPIFSRVSAAREALRNRAEELINEYIDVAKQAKATGDYESAYKALQWLIEHLPKDENNERVVDRSADKDDVQQKQIGDTMPRIQIGIALGGVTKRTQALPSPTVEVIDVKPESE
jgi:phage terminase small subunit